MKTPFPLTWPDGWPRAKRRDPALFHKKVDNGKGYAAKTQLTMVDAREQLQSELDLLRASDVLLSTNVEVTLSGNPRSGQARPSDPGVACYFKLRNRDTVLACDRWTRVEDNIVAIAKHIGAIRAQDRWGVGTVEQAFTGYQALPAPTAKRHWSAVLGIPDTADVGLINRTYRSQAQANAQAGGDQRILLALNMARDEALAERTSS